jgi:hypothetical protein
MNDRPRIEQRAALPYVAIHCHVNEDRVAAAVDSAFPELFRRLGDRVIEPLGPPFIRFLETDPHAEPLELEVAVPVAAGVTGHERLHAGALPAGRYVMLLRAGPYRHSTEPDLADARAATQDWAKQQGVGLDSRKTDRGSAWGCYVENYLVGPVDEPDYSKWQTELMYLTSDR